MLTAFRACTRVSRNQGERNKDGMGGIKGNGDIRMKNIVNIGVVTIVAILVSSAFLVPFTSVDEDVDIYEFINNEFEPDKKFTKERRKAIKELHMSMYFDKSSDKKLVVMSYIE